MQIVQDNRQDDASYEDYGISIDRSGSDYGTIKMEDIASKSFTIKILRSFTPRFKIEQFAKKVVVGGWLCGPVGVSVGFGGAAPAARRKEA